MYCTSLFLALSAVARLSRSSRTMPIPSCLLAVEIELSTAADCSRRWPRPRGWCETDGVGRSTACDRSAIDRSPTGGSVDRGPPGYAALYRGSGRTPRGGERLRGNRCVTSVQWCPGDIPSGCIGLLQYRTIGRIQQWTIGSWMGVAYYARYSRRQLSWRVQSSASWHDALKGEHTNHDDNGDIQSTLFDTLQ